MRVFICMHRCIYIYAGAFCNVYERACMGMRIRTAYDVRTSYIRRTRVRVLPNQVKSSRRSLVASKRRAKR